MPDFRSPRLAGLSRSSLFRALLLSICLHLAVLGLIRIAPIGYEASVTVMQVRLSELAPSEAAAEQGHALAEVSPPGAQTATGPVPAATEPVQATAQAEPAAAALNLPSPVDPRWYGAREVDGHPRAISHIEPAYPETARRRGQTGWVKVRLRIDERGGVTEAEVVESQPAEVFDAATLDAFRRARFEPARRQGLPVRYEGFFRVSFELE